MIKAVVIWLVMVPAIAYAQEAPALRARHVTFSVGIVSSGGYDLGIATASLRGNGAGATPPVFTLFTADSRMARVTAREMRVGVALTRRLAVEVGLLQSNPHITVAIAGDAEARPQQLPGEELQQYFIDTGMTWQLPFTSRRLAPYATAGGGYLRQLHEDRTLGETGQAYYAGAGARYWLRGGDRRSKAVGLRGEWRFNVRRGGIDFENRSRRYPTFAASVFLGL